MLTPFKAPDSDVLAVTPKTAQQYDLTTASDLQPYAAKLALGGPPEWPTRHEDTLGLQGVYDLTFEEFRPLDVSTAPTIAASENGQVQVAVLFSRRPQPTSSHWRTTSAFPAQNIVPIIATDQVTEVLSAALTTQDLIDMNAQLDAQQSLDDVAATWISAHDLG